MRHAAKIEASERLQRVLAILEDRKWHGSPGTDKQIGKEKGGKMKPNIFQTIYYWFFKKWYRIKIIRQEMKCFIQRGRRGFSYMDVQALDFFLAKLISESIYELYRLEDKWMMDSTSKEARLKTLKKISEGFRTYEDNWMYFEDLGHDKIRKSTEKKFQGALDLLAKNFRNLSF